MYKCTCAGWGLYFVCGRILLVLYWISFATNSSIIESVVARQICTFVYQLQMSALMRHFGNYIYRMWFRNCTQGREGVHQVLQYSSFSLFFSKFSSLFTQIANILSIELISPHNCQIPHFHFLFAPTSVQPTNCTVMLSSLKPYLLRIGLNTSRTVRLGLAFTPIDFL